MTHKRVSVVFLDGDLQGDRIYKTDKVTMVSLNRDSDRISEYKGVAVLYMLFDESAGATDRPKVYIGETMNIYRRFNDHRKAKGFWTDCMFFMPNERKLTETQVKWLEMYCIRNFIGNGFYDKLMNCQIPTDVIVAEYD